ncbi:MAG: ABC1 kinase family protein [Sandaracinaceae bacterium]
MALLRAWQLLSRSVVVASVLLPMWVAYAWLYVRQERMGADVPAEAWQRLHERYAPRFYRLAVWMKGGLIKIGQILSTRVDLMPVEWTRELSGLQDSVTPVAWATIRKQLERTYGRPTAAVFRSLDESAVAAASFGQVHRGVTLDGREVALKVKYPDVEGKLRVDLVVFRLSVNLFNLLVPRLDLGAVYTEMSRALRTELDYVQEARFTREIGSRFLDRDGVVIPEVIDELSSPDVICTSWIEGRKITDPGLLADPRVDRRALLQRLLWAWVQMMYVDGVFQSDPHPGNLLVQVDAERGLTLGVIDFGQVKILPQSFHQRLVRCVMAFALGNGEGLVDGLVELGLFDGEDRDRMGPVVVRAMERIRAMDPDRAEGLDFPALRLEVRGALRQMKGVVIPHDLVLYGRTLGLLAGVTHHVAPDVNALALARPLLTEALLGGGPPEDPNASA